MASLFLRTVVFAVLIPGAVLVYVPRSLLGQGSTPRFDLLSVLGAALVAAGGAILVACFVAFMAEGRGTPAPYDPPTQLVTGRLYARVRNPIYVSIVAMLLGEAAIFHSAVLLVYSAITWLLFHLVVVLYEEPGLRHRFGGDYEAYLQRVPRWLPRIR